MSNELPPVGTLVEKLIRESGFGRYYVGIFNGDSDGEGDDISLHLTNVAVFDSFLDDAPTRTMEGMVVRLDDDCAFDNNCAMHVEYLSHLAYDAEMMERLASEAKARADRAVKLYSTLGRRLVGLDSDGTSKEMRYPLPSKL